MKSGAASLGDRAALLFSLALLLVFSGCEKAPSPKSAPPVPPVASVSARELPTLVAIAASRASSHAGESVSPFSGRLSVDNADLISGSLRIVRSLSPVGGMFGNGWRLNWETRLLRGDGSDVLLVDSGVVAGFIRDGESLRAAGIGVLRLDADKATLLRDDGSEDSFDRDGRLVQRRDANGAGTTLRYDAGGLLAEVAAASGDAATFRHHESGRVTEIRLKGGAWVRYAYSDLPMAAGVTPLWNFSYDATGRLASLRGTDAGEAGFTYDAAGRVKSRTWPGGRAERYDYDDANRTVRHTDADGAVTVSQRSADGRQWTMTDAAGQKVVQDFDATGALVAVTGANGRATFAHDARGRLTTITGANGAVWRFEYLGDTALPVSVTGPDGKREMAYDAQRNLIAFDDGRGRAEFAHDKDGRLVSAKMAGGEAWKFALDEMGRRKSATDAQGRVTEFRYDESGRVAGETSGDGVAVGYEYDSGGRLSAMTGADGTRRTFVHDAAGRLTEETDAEGRCVKYEYDAAGRIAKITEPGGAVRRIEYDARGNAVRRTDARGNVVETKFDAAGRVTEITEPGAGVTRFSYTAQGKLAEVTDPLGRTTRYAYDGAGRMTTATSPEGIVTRYGYAADGSVATVQRGAAPVEEVVIEGAGERHLAGGKEFVRRGPGAEAGSITEQFASGLRVTLRHDSQGQPVSYEDSMGGAMRVERDARRIALTDVRGGKTEMQFDAVGKLAKVIGPLGAATQFRRNRVGEIIEAVAPTGDAAKFEYDAAGRLAVRHQPGGGAVRIEYGADGLPAAEIDPAGGRVTFERDKLGRVVKRTDAKGQASTFAYDAHSRIVSRQRADGRTVRYGYDATGRIASVDDGQFPIRYEYDAADRLARIEQPALKRTLTFTHDALGRRVKTVDSTGQETGYEYDEYGRLALLRATPGGEVKFAYDEAGRLKSAAYPNGITGVWSYDASGRITGIACRDAGKRDVAVWTYEYDAAGNRTSARTGGAATSYAYDPAGQLLSEDAGGGKAVRYEYGPGGNRVKTIRAGATIASRCDAAGRLVESGGETFSYDANGNLSERRDAKSVTRYEYDADDQLVKVTLPDGKAVEYGYAPTGERVWRRDAAGRVWSLWDGANLAGELDENLKPLAHYIHGEGIDRPLLRVADGAALCFHADALGSVAKLTDAKGAAVASYEYDAFGNMSGGGVGLRNPFTFTGREWDPAARQYYFRARHYDPAVGRFTSRDSDPGNAAEPLSLNPYLYVANSPTGYTDPTGASRTQQLLDLAQQYAVPERSYNAAGHERVGSYHPDRGIRLFPSAFEGTPQRTIGALVHEGRHQMDINARVAQVVQRYNITDEISPAVRRQIYNRFVEIPGVRPVLECRAHIDQARAMVAAGLHPNHPEFAPVMRGFAANGGNPDQLRADLLNRLDRGAHVTIDAPLVSRPGVETVATPALRETVATPALRETVASPGPMRGDTVMAPVPAPSAGQQVISGAQTGAAVAGVLMTAANVYASVQEGNSAGRILAEGLVGAAVSAVAAGVIGSVASPFVATGLAIGGTVLGAQQAGTRLGDSAAVAAIRQAAAFAHNQDVLMPILKQLAELRALRAEIIAHRTEANKAGTEGQAALAAAQAAVAALPPAAPPLTEARVNAFIAAAGDGGAKKAAAGAGAAKAEGGAASVTQKLAIVDRVANAASPPDADIQNALALYGEAQALVTAVAKDANDVNFIATALKTAADDAKNVPAQRDAANALIPAAEAKVKACDDRVLAAQVALSYAAEKLTRFTGVANTLRAHAGVAANDLMSAPPETQALLSRRMQEIDQAVNWAPAPEVAAASGFAQAAPERMVALQVKITQSRTFLFKIPDALAIPNADAEAARAAAAAAAAQARLSASAASIAKLSAMGGAVEVPSVVRLKAADAKARLAAAGFRKIMLAASDRAPGPGEEGTIEQQNPGGGVKASPSATVMLSVFPPKADASNNMPAIAGKLRVPNGLPGMTEADAVAKVKGAGFADVAIVAAIDPMPDGKAGTVEKHVPAAGSEADAKTTVTLYIFPKPGEILVPGVRGLTVAEAKQQIEGAKLKAGLSVSADPPPDEKSQFTVQAQSPGKGERLKQGEVVTLSIYPKFGTPSPDTVPNVRGLSLNEALAKIRGAGLDLRGVSNIPLPKDKQDQAETVASTIPEGGQPFPADKLVTVNVYAPRARAGGDAPAPVIPEETAPELVGRVFEGKGTWVRDSSGENRVGATFTQAMFFVLDGGKIVATSPKASSETKVTSVIGPEGGKITAHFEWHNNSAVTGDTTIDFTYKNGVLTGRTTQVSTKADGLVVTREFTFILKPK